MSKSRRLRGKEAQRCAAKTWALPQLLRKTVKGSDLLGSGV